MKKLVSLSLVLFLLAGMLFAFTACKTPEREVRDFQAKLDRGETLTVGVLQYMSHPSLDNCYEGVASAFASSGVAVRLDRQIGSASSADSDMVTYARAMVAADYDMIVAIATPAAQAAYAACADTDIPVIFCAVSDPLAAKLVASESAPGDLCTGTSDVLDLSAQLALIRKIQPNVQTIGVIYTSSEQNSLSNLARFREVCSAENIEVIARPVANASEIPAAADFLASRVDCINNFTDNNVVNSLQIVLSHAKDNGIAVYGSEVEQVKSGCLASVSIDYKALGERTAKMALRVISGENIKEMSVERITEASPVLNAKAAKELGIVFPEDLTEAEYVNSDEN